MDRKKIIYIGILLIVTVLVSVTYFSYAFFTSRSEQHGKLNIVTGTLDYKIESSELSNNQITLAANTTKKFEIQITSLNDINSKYELYYQTSSSNIEIGYSSTTSDLPTGKINANGKKKVLVRVSNNSNSSALITFGVIGGFTNNTLVKQVETISIPALSTYCNLALNTSTTFPYNGNDGTDGAVQTYQVPCNGEYQLEVWGASGGDSAGMKNNVVYKGGYGGYSVGDIDLLKNESLYAVVGGSGNTVKTSNVDVAGGYNGGGSDISLTYQNWYLGFGNGTGGGATHIAKVSGLLKNLSSYKGTLKKNLYYESDKILIVAGGGGGAGDFYWSANGTTRYGQGGNAGGYTGGSVTNYAGQFTIEVSSLASPSGGTQLTGGTGTTWDHNSANGSFGLGASATGGAGGGFFGGGAAVGGAGGSGYIGNHNLYNKYMYCYGCKEATNTSSDSEIFTVSTTGNSSYRDTANCPSGYSNEAISKCAKVGNGYARITYIGD